MNQEDALKLLREHGLNAEPRLCCEGEGIFAWTGEAPTKSCYPRLTNPFLIEPVGEVWRVEACLNRVLMPLQEQGSGSLEEVVSRVVAFFEEKRTSLENKVALSPPSPSPDSRLEECLAYVVLRDYEKWLGMPDLTLLEAFLCGAGMRADLTSTTIPDWRVTGPLNMKEFYLPLVSRTGHPSLTIRWAHALEFHTFSGPEIMRELLTLIEEWVAVHGLVVNDFAPRAVHSPENWSPASLTDHLRHVARRPAMYFGRDDAWAFRCYLDGMNRGGDWLGLPLLSGLREIIDELERHSFDSYGSKFGAFRGNGVANILSWIGITPVEH